MASEVAKHGLFNSKEQKDGSPVWAGSLLLEDADDVRVSRVGDGHDADPEVLAACRAKRDVVALVVLDERLGEERVVLNLGLQARGRERGCGRVSDRKQATS